MICFRQNRLKLVAVTALFAAWTLALAFMAFVSAHLVGLWPYVGVSVLVPLALAFGVATFASAMSLYRPATLALDGDHLTFRTWRREQRIAVADIVAFEVMSPTSALRSPGCEKKTGPRKFVSFGRWWEKTPEKMVDELNTSAR
jgi:hypothetical protein